MNTRQKVTIAVGAVLVVNASLNYLHVVKTERQKRERINAELTNNIAAMKVASVRVQENIRAGKYDRVGIAGLMEDFEFEIIRAHHE